LRSDRVAMFLVAMLAATATGCRQDMHDQPRYEAFEAGPFFPDGRASRPTVDGTIARDEPDVDSALLTGADEQGTSLKTSPVPTTPALLARGRERFGIYCTPCHDAVGSGRGMIVQRGFRPPPSLHEPRLRAAPDGYVFDVITRGFGVMPAYTVVPPADRWAIVAYVRALQLSQHVPVGMLAPADVIALHDAEGGDP
jgi:mono/diheme cytochrome c family protein